MELDDLKSSWKNLPSGNKNEIEIAAVLAKAKGSVFQQIRQHITYDALGLSLFLVCYYTMFDGDKKPVIINLVLIAAALLAIVHGIMGYRLSRSPLQDSSLLNSLIWQEKRIRNFAVFSVFYRVVFAAALILFFTYNLKMTEEKWVSLLLIGSIFLVQITILIGIWNSRLKRLSKTIYALKEA